MTKLLILIAIFIGFCPKADADPLNGMFTGDTLVRLPKVPKKEAKVRIGVKIVRDMRVIAQDKQGVNRLRFTKGRAIVRNVRAQISRKSDFYIDRWHLEAIPESWQKSLKKITYNVRLFRQYGATRELEETIGTAKVTGILRGKRMLHNFHGRRTIRFVNKHEQPIAELHLSEPYGPICQTI